MPNHRRGPQIQIRCPIWVGNREAGSGRHGICWVDERRDIDRVDEFLRDRYEREGRDERGVEDNLSRDGL
jgi:hypothetical protein